MAENTPMNRVQDAQTHSEDGVDLTLIRWMLGMTPAERLQTLQRTAQSIQRLRHAARGTRLSCHSPEMVIQTKEETGREKDDAVLAILRRTLQEKQRC